MSESEVVDREPLVIVDTRDEKEISQAYTLLGKYFKPSELESEEAILDRTLGEQKDGVKHGVLVAYRGDRMVCCCIYDHFADTQMVYVEYIATEVDERRHHVASDLLQQGIFGQYEADILIDIVDPAKMEDATPEDISHVCSKSKFWSKQGARKLGLTNFQQPDFEDGLNIDDGSFLAIIPRDPATTQIDSTRMSETLHTINTECNGVENPEETFPEMFEELEKTPIITVSPRNLVAEVVTPIETEDCCQ
ncbi:MAG: hypothetical protein IJW32_02830 [Clostridia bacterium]|nr:hypothetical protein [Clostridia bacterium]